MSGFALVDRYFGHLLGGDLGAVAPFGTRVIETEQRLRRARSYGFVHALWWLWLEEGRSFVSVPPGAGEAVAAVMAGLPRGAVVDAAASLAAIVDPLLTRVGLEPVNRVGTSLVFACGRAQLRPWRTGDCRRLHDGSVPPAEGLSLPEHCFPDGTVFGVVEDGQIVAVAYAHRSGIMADSVADVGVDTAAAYRRRGYAKTCVSAVVGEYVARGGEAVYTCHPDNTASARTAASAGFVPYGGCLVLGSPGERQD